MKTFFKFLFSGIVIPVRSGPLKGKKWILSCGSKFVKGTYEPLQTQAFLAHVKQGDSVFDVGAHVGYFTVLNSILAGGEGEVTAFEPLPLNVKYLKRHVHINDCKNVKIIQHCIADKRGEAFFDNSQGTGTGHLSLHGKLKIKVDSLDNLLRLKEIHTPDFIKIDVEGAEELVLTGAIQLIKESKPKLLISFHSEELFEKCKQIVLENNYAIEMVGENDFLAIPQGGDE